MCFVQRSTIYVNKLPRTTSDERATIGEVSPIWTATMVMSLHFQYWHRHRCWLVLATVPNPRVGSGSSSDPELKRCNGSCHTKTRTVGIGPVLPPNTRHYKSTIFAPIKYLSSDRITIWSVCRLCSFSLSFASRSQICGRTNICRVSIENPGISPQIWSYFTANQWIFVQSKIWQREVKEGLTLHDLHTDHIVIRSELKYLIEATVAGTANMEPRSGFNPAGFMSGPGNKPAKPEGVGLLGGSWPGPGLSRRFQPGPKPGNLEPLLTLLLTLAVILTLPLTLTLTPTLTVTRTSIQIRQHVLL